jgi:hypothetical protein
MTCCGHHAETSDAEAARLHFGESRRRIMIDHVGFSVSDYASAKAFYEEALTPLGYKLVMEVNAQETGSQLPDSAKTANLIFGSAAKASWRDLFTSRSWRMIGRLLTRSTAQQYPREEKTMAHQACARTIIRAITLLSCLIPRGTTSRQSATRRHNIDIREFLGAEEPDSLPLVS